MLLKAGCDQTAAKKLNNRKEHDMKANPVDVIFPLVLAFFIGGVAVIAFLFLIDIVQPILEVFK
jgi:hypothetical protein